MANTLSDHCEVLFQDLCRVSRQARAGLRVEPEAIRADILEALEDIESRGQSGGAGDVSAAVLPSLRVFVDWFVPEVAPACRGQWKAMADGAGSAEFFAGLDAAMSDSGDEANEKLAVYLQCLGLGYTGDRDADAIRKTMVELSARLRQRINADDTAKLCPEAYEHIDRSDLVQPPGKSLALIGVSLVGLVLVLVAMNAFLYSQSASSLVESLSSFADREAGGS